MVFSAFFFGYAAFCFVGGYASDRLGARNVFGIASIVWSVFCGLTATVFSFTSLLVVRVIFGMGEGPLRLGRQQAGQQLVPAPPAGHRGRVGERRHAAGRRPRRPGRRLHRVDLGLAGVIRHHRRDRAVLVRGLDAARHRTAGAERHVSAPPRRPRSPPIRRRPRAGPPIPLGALLTRPAVLATAFAFFGYAYILYFFLSWFPTYLTIARHLSLQSMSFVSTIPWLLGFVGLAAGGSVSDAIFRVTGNAVRARKLVLVGGLLIAAVCVALAGSVATRPGGGHADGGVGVLHVPDRQHLLGDHPRHGRARTASAASAGSCT